MNATETDRVHEIDAWQVNGEWVHRCTVCGQHTIGDAPDLPCEGPPVIRLQS